MTEISARSRTEDVVDRWAHDAGIAGEDEHVKGRAGLRSMAEAWKDRNEGTPAEAAKHAGGGVVREVTPELVDHFLFEHAGNAAQAAARMGGAVGAALGLGVIGNITVTTYELYKAGWADAHAKGDNLHQLAQNDAVNVALAQSLDFAPGFAAREAKERPGVQHGADRLNAQLAGKDASLKPVLQHAADEGFVAAERAWNATAQVPADKRAAAMQQWMKENGFEDRRRNDVAFGKGVEYLLWCRTEGKASGVSPEAEAKKVHDRLVPPQPLVRQG